MVALAATIALAAWAPGPGVAHAQDEGPSFQDSTGLSWSVAALELGLAASALGIAAAGADSGDAVGAVMGLIALIGSAVAGGVAQGLAAPVEPAMIFHHGLQSAALLGGLLSFSLDAAGVEGDVPSIFGVIGLALGAGAGATYSILRMDRLAHDPQLVEEAHVLSWVPIVTAGLVTALFSAIGLGEGAALVGAVSGLIALGIAITLVEIAVDTHLPPEERAMMMTAPLMGYSGTF